MVVIRHSVLGVLHDLICNIKTNKAAQDPLLGRSWGPIGSFLGALAARFGADKMQIEPQLADLNTRGRRSHAAGVFN